MPHLHRDWAHPIPHLHWDWARPAQNRPARRRRRVALTDFTIDFAIGEPVSSAVYSQASTSKRALSTPKRLR